MAMFRTLFTRLAGARAARGSAVAAFVAGLLFSFTATGPLDAQQSYGIRPGDVLRIEVLEDPSLNRTVLVTPDGRITFPQAGALRVSGRGVEAVQRDLTNRLAASFAATPNVFVSIDRLAERVPVAPVPPAPPEMISIFVVGEAGNTGEIELSPGTTVLQMFGVIGGFSQFAATKRIQLRRIDPQTQAETIYRLDYNAIERGTSRSGLTTLMDGDVIVVPQRRLFE